MCNKIKSKVSVVLPVFNAGKYLNEAIDSVVCQTFRDFELIIINDGSTDNSLNIIESYQSRDKRIKVISRKNKGLVYSLNEGISLAEGEYIARMDADDISILTRLEEQVALLDLGADICGCHYEEIDEHGSVISTKKVPLNDCDIMLCLGRTVPFAHGSVMFRKDKFLDCGLSYGNTPYSKAEDYALWCEMYNKSFKFNNLDRFLFKYRNIEGTLTSSKQHLADSAAISLNFIQSNQNEIEANLDCSSNSANDLFIIKNYIILTLLLLGKRGRKIYLLKRINFKYFLKSIKMLLSVCYRRLNRH